MFLEPRGDYRLFSQPVDRPLGIENHVRERPLTDKEDTIRFNCSRVPEVCNRALAAGAGPRPFADPWAPVEWRQCSPPAPGGQWPWALPSVWACGRWCRPLDLRQTKAATFRSGTALAAGGDQDLFWPPLTGWLIALVTSIAGPSVAALRFVWVLFDIGCLLCVRTLASRMAPALFAAPDLARRFSTIATLGYAIYLPAVSFAQFTTSETPALLQLLVVLILLTNANAGRGTYLLAGAIAGTLALTRPSLLPLLAFLPIAIYLRTERPSSRATQHRLQNAAGLRRWRAPSSSARSPPGTG